MSRKVYKYKNPLTATQYVFYKTISNIFLLSGVLMIALAFGPIVKDEAWYVLKQLKAQVFIVSTNNEATQEGNVSDSAFARLLSSKPIILDPVNKDFSLVIEKIGVNVPVVADVSVTNEDAYIEALKQGVAHASSSPYPSKEPGNVYMFAHASVNFWRLGKYATVFNLLRKLEIGDRVHVFHKGSEYVYEVVNKETMKGWNTYPITRAVIEPTLTLQTCDPPGTTLNRLVVTAKLLEVK